MTAKDFLPGYNPNRLLDTIMQRLKIKDDNALARRLALSLTVIRRIREGRMPLTGTLSLAIAQVTGFALDEIKALAGDRRAKFRLNFSC